MAGSFSDYTEAAVLNHIFVKTAFTQPTNLYIALGTGADDTGLTGEVSGGSYARVSTNGTNWNAASGTNPTTIDNSTDITFPTATADWASAAPLTHFGIYDAPTAGNLIAWADLNISKSVLNGDTAKFLAGALTVSLN